MPRIAIFIVAYNAEATLGGVIERIPAPIMDKVEEIFVFDDASQDRTSAVGREYARRLGAGKLVIHRNPVNLMYGGNQQRGYRYAIERGFDIVVLLHGDGQYAPEVMQELLTPLERGQADMVMGSRMLIEGGAIRGNMPRYKFVGNKILTRAQNFLLGTRLSEFHSGYRAYAVAALATIPLGALTQDWHFDTQIILHFLQRGYRVKEVPIPTYYGDEISRVNGIPYAINCIRESLVFALAYRWRIRGRSDATLPPAPRPEE